MADEVASLLVRITADGSQAVGVLNGVASTVTTLADKNASMMNKIASAGNLAGSVGRTITKTFGVATVAGLVASAKAAGQLNKELANIGTLSVPTERLKEFKGQIQDIAIATGKDTSDISEGTYQVISAFGDAADTMDKVEINAKAAKAGLATTADSIALTSAVTKAYGDTSADAVQHVADLAFKTVELGQTTFPELAQNMQQVTSLSKQLGTSQEELFGAYATLTGVTGGAAEVQTQLKAVYTALLKPSENMEKAIHSLGYESGYTMAKTLGFAGTLDALVKATDGSDEALLSLFNNQRALPAVLALTGAQADVFSEKLEKMKNASGAATKAFEVQTEGVAKTGFTLEQAKVKMQVAAQNFGESAAPIIGDFADIVDKASTKLATMSDEERQAIINTGVLTTKIGVGLAVGGKALTVGTKLVGTVKTIGTALAGAGALTNPVILGIAGITTAVIAGKSAYDAWYNSQYRWTKGLSYGNAEIQKGMDSIKNLSKIQQDIKAAKLVIENPASSQEQVQQAKTKIEEIKSLLEKEYDLKIKSDNSNLESTVETLKNINELNTRQNINSQSERLERLKPKFDEYQSQKASLEADMEAALQAQEKYSELKLKLSELDRTSKDYAQSVRDLGVEYGVLSAVQQKTADPTNVIIKASDGYEKAAKSVEKYSQKLNDSKGSYDEYIAISTEIANWQTELINTSALEGNADKVQNYLSKLGETVNRAELDMNGYAQAAALAMNGVDKLETAWTNAANGDGTALTGIVNDYIRAMNEFGASAEETSVGASLIKNGFRTVGEAASAGKLDIITQQANELAHSMRTIPEDKSIVINANGDISIIEDVQAAVDKINANSDVQLTVSATGDVSVLESTDEKLKELINNNQVTITFNAQTNGFDISDLHGNNLGQITADGKINWTNGEVEKPKDEKADGTIDYKLGEVEKPENATAEGTINYKIGKVEKPKENAKGTKNFSGGLAMVNDDGKSDPRELIIDRGRAFIPEGRDVILPLSRGAKVYTSDQTKAIMRGMGIPHYAEGKNNSDAFTTARDDWSHYTKTHSVTTAQELQKWLNFQKQYKENEKDIWDIEEQVFSLQQKITKELNDQSKAYIEERSALNDWNEYGDSALEAFGRIKDRNYQDLQSAKITWNEYVDNVADAGETLYDGMKKYSDGWLEHQQKYHNMSIDEYIAGIDREEARLEEFYANDIVNYQKYIEEKQAYEEKRFDAIAEKNAAEYAAWKKDADAYEELRSTYGDWDKYGDSEEDFLKRKISRVQEFFKTHKISFEEYIDDTNQYSMDLYKAQEGYVDDLFQKQQDYISDLQEQFSKQEQALRDSWTVEDRKSDMAEVSEQLDIYAGAVTDRGQQKYKELQEQMKQLQRDEELYNLQVANNATIEKLQADYEAAEALKTDFIKGIAQSIDVDFSGLVSDLTSKVSGTGDDITWLLGQLLTAFQNFKIDAPSTTYADNRVVTVNGVMPNNIGNFMGGVNN